MNVLQLPYLYRDSEHMWRVLDGEILRECARESAEYEVPDYAPDGREITTTMLLPNLRLIAKSDYWNNIPNYILLDDYVYSRKP